MCIQCTDSAVRFCTLHTIECKRTIFRLDRNILFFFNGHFILYRRKKKGFFLDIILYTYTRAGVDYYLY